MRRRPVLIRNCQECGEDCFCDGYIRNEKLLCRKCAEYWDMKYAPHRYKEIWVDEAPENF